MGMDLEVAAELQATFERKGYVPHSIYFERCLASTGWSILTYPVPKVGG